MLNGILPPARALVVAGILCLSAAVVIGCNAQSNDADTADNITQTDSGVSRIESVRAKGKVDCASQIDLPGFGFVDSDGNLRGFDIDLCRAVAAAIFGDSKAVEIRHIPYIERGPILQAAEIDILSRTTTWK